MPHAVPSLSRFAVALTVFGASLALAVSGAVASTGGTQAATTATKNVSVRQIQRALGIRADGVMGPKTRRALKRFQRVHGLEADGIPGPATLAALGLTSAPQDRGLDATSVLAKIAECESGGDITAVSRDGRYYGKYQFSIDTWEALGGTGKPSEADEATQDALAAKLYAERGLEPWPTCATTID